MARIAGNPTSMGLMVLGLTLMITPLALWVAWTETILLVVLAVGILAGVLYCLLVRYDKSALPVRRDAPDGRRLDDLPDETVEQLQRLHPFIHHHRASGGPKYQRAMAHLKRLLYREPR